MPHYFGRKSSELSPEMKLRSELSRLLSQVRRLAEALLLQSNDDERETKFHFAKVRRRLSRLRALVARLAVCPNRLKEDGTTVEPWRRAKEILIEADGIEKSLARFYRDFAALSPDYMRGIGKCPSSCEAI